MKVRLNSVVKMAVAAAALACATGASAQSAGQLTAQFGFNQLTPKVESGDLSGPALPFTKADVERDIQPVLIFAYGLTNNISAEVALGTPYKHKINGAGSIEGRANWAPSRRCHRPCSCNTASSSRPRPSVRTSAWARPTPTS